MSSERPAKLQCPGCAAAWLVPVPPANPSEFRKNVTNHHDSTGHFGTMSIDQVIEAVLASVA